MKLRRGGGLRFGLRLLILILLSAPFGYNRAFLPGTPDGDQGRQTRAGFYIAPHANTLVLDILASLLTELCAAGIIQRP